MMFPCLRNISIELVRAGPEELCWENGLLKISFESFEELERTAFFSKKITLW